MQHRPVVVVLAALALAAGITAILAAEIGHILNYGLQNDLHNQATLQHLGFENLGNGYYFKTGVFLVKLDWHDRVADIITLSIVSSRHERYKSIAVAPKTTTGQETSLLFISDDGSCSEDGNGTGPCEGL
jgi:hypothetical protein